MNARAQNLGLVAWLIAFALLLATQPAYAKKILTLSHTNGPTATRQIASEEFARLVSEYSEQRLEVRVFHSGQLANDPKAIELMKLGGLDFTITATGSYAPHYPNLNLLTLPYLVDNYEQGWRLYDESPWVAQQFEGLAKKTGIRVLATWEAGFRQFTTTIPLAPPGESNKEKMRVYPNESLRSMVEAFGYNPVIIPAPEVYLALQQGTVVGQENPLDTIYSMRFFEVAPRISLTSHIYSPTPFTVAESTWKKLSEADKAAVKRAAKEAGDFSRQRVKESEPRLLEEMVQRGASVHRPDLKPFQEAVTSVYDQARDRYGNQVDLLLADSQAIKTGEELPTGPLEDSYSSQPISFPLSLSLSLGGLITFVVGSLILNSRTAWLSEYPAGDETPLFRYLGNAIDWTVIWCGFAIVILMFGNVLSRFVFKFDVAWSSELSVFLMIWAIFLGGVSATRRRSHMRVAEAVNLLPQGAQRWTNTIANAASSIVLLLLLLSGLRIAQANLGQDLVALGWPVGFQYAALPVGAGFALLFTLRDLVLHLRGSVELEQHS
ncbi:DctP family TRAP transporter solute-binding subunit [Pelagicoccus mobilis]|uniref:DctP family TRAP transporter solute-binding subunit n=1 Tax=Pelagicoccus mobilis TaxID=415221 RepID=A0A934VU11_9BACT|nr:DctP family TRAP transporter solute-binding subunit [Pelagicoccus mobilis]MBK1880283.1 DctP family TRAP transporter solute-binding subunit [Pelagicoccus mobilis]